jgi:EAL domain-containing protein (putative c-di-GMP-specific phosphodiesterase class I)
VALAHNLGKQVIAKGVETPGQVALLQPLHCEYAQWYFSPNQ